MNTTSQKGFAHAFLIIGLVVALVGALGFVFWQNFIYQEPTTQNANDGKKSDKTIPKTESYAPEIPSGWSKQAVSSVGVEFAIPPEWEEGVEVKKFAVNENIVIFQDVAAIYANFSSETQSWEYFRKSYDSPIEKITAPQFKLEASSTKVEDKWNTAVYYEPSHVGPMVRAHIFVVRDNEVFRFSLPTIKDDFNQDDWEKYSAQYNQRLQTVIKDNVPPFIKTITFN